VPTPLEALRQRLHLTVEDLAARLNVSKTQVQKWERRWEDIPPDTLREMAVSYGVSVSSILGEETPVEEWGRHPFAINEEEELYGTLRLTFTDGQEGEYPISREARESVLGQLRRRSFIDCENRAGKEPWLYFWGMDDRIAIARMSCVSEIALLSDDDRQAPYYAHPEIYRLLVTESMYDDEPIKVFGQALSEAMATHFDVLGGQAAAIQQATHACLIFRDGRELYASCTNAEEVSPLFLLDMTSSAIPTSAFLQIEDPTNYHEAYFVNFDALRFISIPSEAYHRYIGADD